MISMTGFGRGEVETTAGTVTVEARSENHRFLDVSIQLPNGLVEIEPQLVEVVKKLLMRGKVRVTVSIDRSKRKTPGFEMEPATRTYAAIEKVRKGIGIAEPTGMGHLLMVKELFISEEKTPLGKKHRKAIAGALSLAIANLKAMRLSEGEKLRKDLQKRIAKLERLLGRITSQRKGFAAETSTKLRERIEKLLEGSQVDEYRLVQEVAFLSERSDITEEVVRLRAHIDKFTENFTRTEPVGRELDFLLQEMNRESSTIAAKAKDAKISHFIVELKSEMERIKEQVQNIE